MDAVVHTIRPIFGPESHTLLLGSIPSPRSRAAGYYYAHPKNRFWPVLASVYGTTVPQDGASRRALILDNGLALWDVLARCEIEGASDASIRSAEPNDISGLIAQTRITRVFCTGKTAAALYERLIAPVTGLPCRALPSTSPANCRVSLEELARIYSEALYGGARSIPEAQFSTPNNDR